MEIRKRGIDLTHLYLMAEGGLGKRCWWYDCYFSLIKYQSYAQVPSFQYLPACLLYANKYIPIDENSCS